GPCRGGGGSGSLPCRLPIDLPCRLGRPRRARSAEPAAAGRVARAPLSAQRAPARTRSGFSWRAAAAIRAARNLRSFRDDDTHEPRLGTPACDLAAAAPAVLLRLGDPGLRLHGWLLAPGPGGCHPLRVRRTDDA